MLFLADAEEDVGFLFIFLIAQEAVGLLSAVQV